MDFDAAAREEQRLPMYGLVGGRRVPGISRGGRPGRWDSWEERYLWPDMQDEDQPIKVHAQRRAIHGGGTSVGSRRVTGSLDLVRSDAAWAVIMCATEEHLGEIRRTHGPQALRERSQELFAASLRLGEDESAWRPAQLTIDSEPVDAIELNWEDSWVVLHIGHDKVADVWVCGPPGTKPEPLAVDAHGQDNQDS